MVIVALLVLILFFLDICLNIPRIKSETLDWLYGTILFFLVLIFLMIFGGIACFYLYIYPIKFIYTGK